MMFHQLICSGLPSLNIFDIEYADDKQSFEFTNTQSQYQINFNPVFLSLKRSVKFEM